MDPQIPKTTLSGPLKNLDFSEFQALEVWRESKMLFMLKTITDRMILGKVLDSPGN